MSKKTNPSNPTMTKNEFILEHLFKRIRSINNPDNYGLRNEIIKARWLEILRIYEASFAPEIERDWKTTSQS